jgi:hypothetical protein
MASAPCSDSEGNVRADQMRREALSLASIHEYQKVINRRSVKSTHCGRERMGPRDQHLCTGANLHVRASHCSLQTPNRRS